MRVRLNARARTRPLHHREPEPAGPERGDHQAPRRTRRVGLGVAGAAERDEVIALDIGAALCALDEVVHVEADAEVTRRRA